MKKLFALLLVAGLGMSIVGCEAKKPDAPKPEVKDADHDHDHMDTPAPVDPPVVPGGTTDTEPPAPPAPPAAPAPSEGASEEPK